MSERSDERFMVASWVSRARVRRMVRRIPGGG
jgi:hypothetical protein